MTASDRSCGVLIEAELTVGLPNAAIRLHSEGSTLYVEANSFSPLRELWATSSSEVGDWLRQRGLDSPLRIETPIVVRVRGIPVARYEPSKPLGRLSRLLGVSPVQVDLLGVVRAAKKQLRAAI